MKTCPVKRSEMAPCVITDGPICYAANAQGKPTCVGCERAPNLTGVEPPKDWKGPMWESQPAPPDLEPLKPCPFCGGSVKLERPLDMPPGSRREEWWGVVCRNTINLGGTCAIQQLPSRTKEAAIERWNRRA